MSVLTKNKAIIEMALLIKKSEQYYYQPGFCSKFGFCERTSNGSGQ